VSLIQRFVEIVGNMHVHIIVSLLLSIPVSSEMFKVTKCNVSEDTVQQSFCHTEASISPIASFLMLLQK
jgi:hypothetical protein